MPAGNVYSYFRTKDDLVAAVITGYIERANAVLREIDIRYRTPKARLKALIRQLTAHGDQIAEAGCPVGTLCSELGKRAGIDLSQGELMMNPLVWAEQQFRSLGRTDARELSQQLMADYERKRPPVQHTEQSVDPSRHRTTPVGLDRVHVTLADPGAPVR